MALSSSIIISVLYLRVDAVLSQLNAEHEAFERLSHLQAKLNNIEQKLDALMALVTTHVYGHDS